ncbi:LysR family transcriptional regulator [Pseudomonas sp. ICMP 10191]|uniref:LysR family transcriptional regulator n=1 Tax=Pseudomonas sp. ICMP 10191 TaxID=1198294 RepID=UPI0007319158|nr:LysR family transcriptional regulator [Pseudomonas sp. ICMP 10191]KTC00414.1 LysR family transcriptional regulator [Pseudomonas sp. ICMP 10191]
MEFLNDMALFVEVVKARSFTRAAETLGIPNSTLSRRISELEKGIGLRLLHRTTRKIEPTEAGQLYFERCKRIVDEARMAHEQLGEMLARPSGLLRASLPVDFATVYLAPLIAEFAQLYPGISFEFDLSPRQVDLISDPVDVVIRMGEPPNSNLIARKLTSLRRGVYASPRYLEVSGELEHPADLVNHECLRMHGAGADRWTLSRDSESVDINVGGRFELNSVGMLRRLASLDLGIAVLPGGIVAQDLADGKLRKVLPQWQASPVSVYALTETRLLPAKTQRVIEFLRDKLEGA